MRARWEHLHAGLVRSLNTPDVHGRFRTLRSGRPALQYFASPQALLDVLHAGRDRLDAKDVVLAALVDAVQARGREAALAQHLLLLGLWPGLDAVYRRKLRYFRRTPEELVSAICEAFVTVVARADLSRIRRVAATLVRNTERHVLEGCRPAWDVADNEVDLHSDTERWWTARPRGGSSLGLGPDAYPEDEIAAIRRQLVELVGDDADLVIGAAIYGCDQHELADQLGITHAAARKRFQRAIVRLRERFAGGA